MLLEKIRKLIGGSSKLGSYRKVLLPTTREEVVVTGAKGPYLNLRHKGEEKVKVIDATSQVGTNPLGHRYEPILKEMRELFRQDSDFPLMLAGNDVYHPLQKELAEKFTEIYPGDLSKGDLKTYYCNSGSEAVERGCLKSAQLYSGGNSFVAFENAFHGRTSLALSHTNSKGVYKEGYNFMARTVQAPFASKSGGELHNDPGENADRCLDLLESKIRREGPENVNSIMIEPLQGEGGYNVPHPRFIKGVREIASDLDIPMIADEVQASLRTGEWFSIDNFDVQPDMISAAKAFSGGLTPFGASLIKDRFATEKSSKHSSTFGGNPKDCFVALKTIKLIEENDFLDNAKEQGSHLGERFDEIEKSDIVHESRGIGLFRGLEFREDGKPAPKLRDRILKDLLEEHNILASSCGNDRYNSAIRFLLPVNIEREQIEEIADAVMETVKNHSD
ncbi:MAG: aspartate aminotransferase family protein [Candidatus Nanohaloarchaea archaeon]|nr:aspartate aminotransferase family protein [Candidatus Nanohaloarchaea archaeon]